MRDLILATVIGLAFSAAGAQLARHPRPLYHVTREQLACPAEAVALVHDERVWHFHSATLAWRGWTRCRALP